MRGQRTFPQLKVQYYSAGGGWVLEGWEAVSAWVGVLETMGLDWGGVPVAGKECSYHTCKWDV